MVNDVSNTPDFFPKVDRTKGKKSENAPAAKDSKGESSFFDELESAQAKPDFRGGLDRRESRSYDRQSQEQSRDREETYSRPARTESKSRAGQLSERRPEKISDRSPANANEASRPDFVPYKDPFQSSESDTSDLSFEQEAESKSSQSPGQIKSAATGLKSLMRPEGQARQSVDLVGGRNSVYGMPAMALPEGGDVEYETNMVSELETFRDHQAQVKQKAMLDFMGQMQAQVGVTPQSVVQAFAKMDEDTLHAPPEQAKNVFIKNLGVSGDKAKVAALLYDKMVAQTGEAELNQKLAGGLQVKYEVLATRDMRLQKLNESIDQLNSSFFMRNAAIEGTPDGQKIMAETPELQRPAAQQKNRTQGALSLEKLGLTGMGQSAAPAAALPPAVATAGEDAGAFADLPTPENMSAPSNMATNPLATPMMSMNAGQAGGQFDTAADSGGQGNLPGQISQQGFGKKNLEAVNQQMQAGGLKKYSADTTVSAKSAGIVGNDPATAGQVSSGGQTQAPISQAGPLTPGAMLANGPRATDEEKSANIQEIIKQAQVIAKKGGGEMKMELKPEGMGTVNLKVSVQDGQVSIQMVADNDHAKRLLENGMSELKQNLASHKLHVDSMKVDLHDPSGKKTDMDMQQDAQREQARQFASDFMGGFRDDRQGFYQDMMDNFGWKSYNQNPKRPDLKPEQTSAKASAKAASVARPSDGTTSRRLNLVA